MQGTISWVLAVVVVCGGAAAIVFKSLSLPGGVPATARATLVNVSPAVPASAPSPVAPSPAAPTSQPALPAAVAAPAPSPTRDHVWSAADVEQLREMSGQFKQYFFDHGHCYPFLHEYPHLEQMVNKTRRDGEIDPEGEFGPYFRTTPVNPVNGFTRVKLADNNFTRDTVVTEAGVGFVFNCESGEVFATDRTGMRMQTAAPASAPLR